MNKWDKIFVSDPKYKPLNELYLIKLLEKIRKEINQTPKIVVDLGCGTAETVFQFAEKGFDVTGIDFSRVALQKLQQKIDSTNLKNIKLIYADLNNFKINLIADIYLCHYVYSFIDDKDFFLKNMSASMKENSIFILITPVFHKDTIYKDYDKTRIAVDFDETQKKLNEFFTSVNVYHHDYIDFREDYVTFLIKK